MTSRESIQSSSPKSHGPTLYRYQKPYEGHGSFPIDTVAIQYNCPLCHELVAVDFDSLRYDDPLVICRKCGKEHKLPLVPCYYENCTGVYTVCRGEKHSVRDAEGEWDNVCSQCGVRYPGHVASKTRCRDVYCNECKRHCPLPQVLPQLAS